MNTILDNQHIPYLTNDEFARSDCELYLHRADNWLSEYNSVCVPIRAIAFMDMSPFIIKYGGELAFVKMNVRTAETDMIIASPNLDEMATYKTTRRTIKEGEVNYRACMFGSGNKYKEKDCWGLFIIRRKLERIKLIHQLPVEEKEYDCPICMEHFNNNTYKECVNPIVKHTICFDCYSRTRTDTCCMCRNYNISKQHEITKTFIGTTIRGRNPYYTQRYSSALLLHFINSFCDYEDHEYFKVYLNNAFLENPNMMLMRECELSPLKDGVPQAFFCDFSRLMICIRDYDTLKIQISNSRADIFETNFRTKYPPQSYKDSYFFADVERKSITDPRAMDLYKSVMDNDNKKRMLKLSYYIERFATYDTYQLKKKYNDMIQTRFRSRFNDSRSEYISDITFLREEPLLDNYFPGVWTV